MLASQHAERYCREGDRVILYSGYDRVHSAVLKHGDSFNHSFGCFRHSDIIGKPYGSKIKAFMKDTTGKRKPGFVQLLKPTSELWQAGPLVHRTQIIYTLDLSVITFFLELSPGKVVVETGTGSGALSIGIARCLSAGGVDNPFNGKLHTFEFHPVRAESARKMFEDLELGHIINVTHRDACEEGFPLPDGSVDAVFLDLPSPWKAIDEAWRILKSDGRICSFSPCIEQVQRASKKLMETGFHDIRTVEVLRRDMDVFPDVREYNIPDLEALRKRDILDPLSSSDAQSLSSSAPDPSGDVGSLGKKRQREEDDDDDDDEGDEGNDRKVDQREGEGQWDVPKVPPGQLPPLADGVLESLVVKPKATMIAHTAYLTFATKSSWGPRGKNVPVE